MLKFVTLLVSCYVVLQVVHSSDDLPPEVKQMLKNLHDTCVKETGVAESEISDANNGKFSGTENLKCYLKCLMASVGVLDDDGTFDGEAYVDLLPPHLTEYGKKIVDACKPEGNGACEIAYNLNVCSYNTDPSRYQIY
ncbi:general odorant-binding protein 83a-like [Planococcus citri]|uniref:general odorant-binding protein 83a-like n=1 Tax=Planococcus citri TaxID=170843 RepID=UPI0031F725DB